MMDSLLEDTCKRVIELEGLLPPFVEALVMGNFPELCQKRDAAA